MTVSKFRRIILINVSFIIGDNETQQFTGFYLACKASSFRRLACYLAFTRLFYVSRLLKTRNDGNNKENNNNNERNNESRQNNNINFVMTAVNY